MRNPNSLVSPRKNDAVSHGLIFIATNKLLYALVSFILIIKPRIRKTSGQDIAPLTNRLLIFLCQYYVFLIMKIGNLGGSGFDTSARMMTLLSWLLEWGSRVEAAVVYLGLIC